MTRFAFSLAVLWLFTSVSQAAGVSAGAGQTVALASDLQLAGTDSVNLVGTAQNPCILNGGNFSILSANNWTGHIKITFCTIRNLGTAVQHAIAVSMLEGSYIDIENSTFDASSSISLTSTTDVTFRNNIVLPNAIFPADMQVDNSRPFFRDSGAGSSTKYFQGNRIYRGGIWLNSPNWMVGGANDSDGNLFIGARAGVTALGQGTLVSHNYSHILVPVSPAQPWWAELSNIIIGAGVIAEDNVIRTGQWVLRATDGEVRNNVILEVDSHAFVQYGSGSVHHNIFSGIYLGADGYPATGPHTGESFVQQIYSTDSLKIYNNVFDARGTTGAMVEIKPSNSILGSLRNNVFYYMNMSTSGLAGHPVVGPCLCEALPLASPNRLSYADYNLFYYDPATPTKDNYGISVAGKTERVDNGFARNDAQTGGPKDQQVDPKFTGPLPLGFPFSDADIKSGTVTVSRILAHYRYVFSPATGSPLINSGDPTDGTGTDIGAVEKDTAPAITLTNQPPVASAGGIDYAITLPDKAYLDGYATDDGLPNGVLTVKWTQVSGPGTVTFSNPNAGYSTATFSQPGVYVLRMTASDGALTGSDTVSITVGGTATSPIPPPTGVTSTALSSSQISVSWAAVPDSRVVGYVIYRNGTQVGTASSTAFLDSGLSPSTTYSYTVAATDGSNNASAQSAAASAASLAATPAVPVVTSFTSSPTSVTTGQAVILNWTVTGTPTPTVSISPAIGQVGSQGSATINPNGATTYTLTAVNSAGTATAATTITLMTIGTAGNHPRLWLTTSMINLMRAKVAANDPDWLTLKSQADSFLAMNVPNFTVTAATNSNPVQFTLAHAIPWSGSVSIYIGGGTGGWTGINAVGDHPSPTTATKTGTNTFTVPIDSSSFGSFNGQQPVLFFNEGGFDGYIHYPYEGAGWLTALQDLSLAYKATGNTAYAVKGVELLAYIGSLGNAGLIAPESIDSGFPSRTTILAVAQAYDWLYEFLSPNQKTMVVNAINCWYDWFKASAFDNNGPAYSNYFGGHLLGFGLAGLATDGDNSRAPEITSAIRLLFNTYIPAAFTAGGFAGGYPVESYTYGPNHFIRLLEYMMAIKTATGEDLFTNTDYAQKIARNLVYNLKPNRWQSTDEGDFSGDYTGVMPPGLVVMLSSLLDGQGEGAWMQFFYKNLAPAPAAQQAQVVDPTTRFLFYDSTKPALDYRPTSPLYFHSSGDEHVYNRTTWADDAVWSSFEAGASHWAGHQMRSAGHVSIQRGNDYLLVNSGQWKGQSGYQGSPNAFDLTSWRANTLFFTDDGDYLWPGADYMGGQGYWGTNNVLAYEGSPDAVYSKADETTAYMIPAGYADPAKRTLTYFYRNYVALADGTVVLFDRIRGTKSSYTKKLYFHFNPIGGAPSISGTTVVSQVGNSKLFLNTLLPTSPLIQGATDPVSAGDSTPITYRVEVSDNAAGTELDALNVLIPAASSVVSMPATSRVDATKMVGVLTVTDMPRIVLFSRDGTAQSSATYNAPYSSTQIGLHMLMDMTPGTYDIIRDGLTILSNVVASSQGVLRFKVSGGSGFSVTLSGAPPTPPTLPCDLNGDSVVNDADVDAAKSLILNDAVTIAADLDGDGKITVVDLQRVINARNGTPCRVGK